MTSGVSRHVLVDDPEKIHFGLTHLGDEATRSGEPATPRPGTVQLRKRPDVRPDRRQTTSATGRASAHQPMQTKVHPVQASGGRNKGDAERQRAFEVWSELYIGQPVNAKDVLRAARVSKNESTVRRWCRAWEKETAPNRTVPADDQAAVRTA